MEEDNDLKRAENSNAHSKINARKVYRLKIAIWII